MKTQKLISGIVLTVILLMGCSKNEDEEIVVEATPQYPMKSLIESGHMELKNSKQNSAIQFEAGYKFKSFKNGSIKALGVRVPDNGEYRVTLWNFDTEEVLATVNITATSQLLSFQDVEPININSGVDYFVSVNTNDYYIFNDSGNVIFPAESEDILITQYRVRTGMNLNQLMPHQTSTTSYLGMVDIKFVPNN